MKTKMIPIFNAGHAGVVNGFYETPGKRSPNGLGNCGVLYEGAANRWVVNRLIEKMDREHLPYFHACPELTDIPLSTRVARADQIYRKHKNTYYLSIHHNAGLQGQDNYSGIEGFTSPGATKSDLICEMFLVDLQKEFQAETRMRTDISDGDLDKEAKYYELIYTDGPSLLLELEFMDSLKGYNFIWDENNMKRKVDCLFKTIKNIYFKGV